MGMLVKPSNSAHKKWNILITTKMGIYWRKTLKLWELNKEYLIDSYKILQWKPKKWIPFVTKQKWIPFVTK